MKVCSKCHAEYPATAEFFSRNKTRKDGLRNECKTCAAAAQRQWYEANREHVRAANDAWKAANPERYEEWTRAYNKARSEEQRERKRIWRTTHSEEVKQQNRAWYETHGEQACAAAKAYREANPERVRATKRVWHEANRDKVAARRQRRRARIMSATGSFTELDIKNLYRLQKGRCWWDTKHKLDKGYHVDHRIPLSKGGSNDIANIVLACPRCNLSKYTKMPDEFAGRLL